MIELVVVLVMLGLLALLLFPTTSGSLLEAQKKSTSYRGAQVVKSLYARNLDRSQIEWHESYAINGVEGVDWSSSDKYFLDVIGGWEQGRSNEYFNTISPLGDVDYTFVAARGGSGANPLKGSVTNAQVRTKFVDPHKKTDRGGAHNAWCVTLGLNSSTKATIPFMFTKNLRFADDKISSLEPYDMTRPDDPSSGPLNEAVDILGGKRALAIGIQGNVIAFREESFITLEQFNPNGVDNAFIWPAGSPEPE